MAFVSLHSRQRWARLVPASLGGPCGDFLVAAVLLAVAVGVTASILSGAHPLATGAAVTGFAAGAAAAGRGLRRVYPHAHLGLCNLVTLGRLALAMALLGPLLSGTGASWPVFAVAAVALTLDGFDGWLARRQKLVSVFGARFDMEVDSALALVLAALAATGPAGAAALLLGLPRYLFALAGWRLPWMRRDLPERFSRKVVCVLQLGVLIALQAPVLPQAWALPLVAVAGGAVAWSFAVDLAWQWRRRA